MTNDKRQTTIKILFIGDIVQRIGRKAIAKILPDLKKELEVDLVIANGEHASTGFGITEKAYNELIESGVDFLTSGNHIWRKKDFIPFLDNKNIKVIRPANFPDEVPGRGYDIIKVKNQNVAIINFVGVTFMNPDIDSPFRRVDEILKKTKKAKIVIIDFHADITSEKVAFGLYLNGKVSAVLGTHTHVPTADQRILDKGTAYISDVGMVGPADSILGLIKEPIIERFRTGMPAKHEVPLSGKCFFNSVLLEVKSNGKTLSIERIDREVTV